MEEIEILIKDLDVDLRTKEILLNGGYKKLSDLTKVKAEEVERLFDIPRKINHDYNGPLAFRQLRVILHNKYNITFFNEYEDLGLTPEIANVPISDLELPTAIKNVLVRQLGAHTFGDLLIIDYRRILKSRNFGEKSAKILKDYVHSLGYTLKNEHLELREVLTSLKNKGETLLENIFEDPRIYLIFYRNNIFTIDDLVNFGPAVNNLVGFGPFKRKIIAEKMQELNLTFNVPYVDDTFKIEFVCSTPKSEVKISPNDITIEQVRKENDAIRTRIEKKEALILEYERLMAERNELLARESELDQLIEEKIKTEKSKNEILKLIIKKKELILQKLELEEMKF